MPPAAPPCPGSVGGGPRVEEEEEEEEEEKRGENVDSTEKHKAVVPSLFFCGENVLSLRCGIHSVDVFPG